tara:strand:+ start:5029 stop:7407 length:2379 start_codon:yes stop_codon:yes gene_type:complete
MKRKKTNSQTTLQMLKAGKVQETVKTELYQAQPLAIVLETSKNQTTLDQYVHWASGRRVSNKQKITTVPNGFKTHSKPFFSSDRRLTMQVYYFPEGDEGESNYKKYELSIVIPHFDYSDHYGLLNDFNGYKSGLLEWIYDSLGLAFEAHTNIPGYITRQKNGKDHIGKGVPLLDVANGWTQNIVGTNTSPRGGPLNGLTQFAFYLAGFRQQILKKNILVWIDPETPAVHGPVFLSCDPSRDPSRDPSLMNPPPDISGMPPAIDDDSGMLAAARHRATLPSGPKFSNTEFQRGATTLHPIKQFIQEYALGFSLNTCQVQVSCVGLWKAYVDWCSACNRTNTVNEGNFGIKLSNFKIKGVSVSKVHKVAGEQFTERRRTLDIETIRQQCPADIENADTNVAGTDSDTNTEGAGANSETPAEASTDEEGDQSEDGAPYEGVKRKLTDGLTGAETRLQQNDPQPPVVARDGKAVKRKFAVFLDGFIQEIKKNKNINTTPAGAVNRSPTRAATYLRMVLFEMQMAKYPSDCWEFNNVDFSRLHMIYFEQVCRHFTHKAGNVTTDLVRTFLCTTKEGATDLENAGMVAIGAPWNGKSYNFIMDKKQMQRVLLHRYNGTERWDYTTKLLKTSDLKNEILKLHPEQLDRLGYQIDHLFVSQQGGERCVENPHNNILNYALCPKWLNLSEEFKTGFCLYKQAYVGKVGDTFTTLWHQLLVKSAVSPVVKATIFTKLLELFGNADLCHRESIWTSVKIALGNRKTFESNYRRYVDAIGNFKNVNKMDEKRQGRTMLHYFSTS